jgi:hypothetical protein
LRNRINEERIAGTLRAAPLSVLSQLHGRSAQRSAIAADGWSGELPGLYAGMLAGSRAHLDSKEPGWRSA